MITPELLQSKVTSLDLTLPNIPMQAGNYLTYRRADQMLYLCGILAVLHGEIYYKGKVGQELDLQEGINAARLCALNTLSILNGAMQEGNFGLTQVVQLNGFVNAPAGYEESPKVINGASNLFEEVLGKPGQHSRAAVAVAGLPMGSAVEIQVICQVGDL